MKGIQIKKLIIVAILILAIVIVIVSINMNSKGKESVNKIERTEISNPITEVKSVEEMKKYLGYDVPVLNKEVEKYIVIGEEKYADHARIIYKDGTEFDMDKTSGDVSGINGSTFLKDEKINNVNVKFYSYEFDDTNLNYVIWESKGYSYSYINNNGEVSEEDINQLIDIIK